jgi:2-hydroxychromene-2-carboxylate isomerase
VAADAPVFSYDFNSPYAYLASSRVDAVLPVAPRWEPIAFAFVLRAHDRTPWSMQGDASRAAGLRECERRAVRYGLPPLRLPPGWPRESYSLLPLRAAWVAEEHELLREFSAAAFARNFAAGAGLRAIDDVLAAAREAGLDEAAVRDGVERAEVKDRLTAATEAAIARGVPGVPTVTAAGETFWGDDRLEAAAAALAGG